MSTPPTPDPAAAYARCLEDERVQGRRQQRRLTWLVRVRIADLVLAVVLAGEACSHGGRFGLAATLGALAFVALTVAIAIVEQRNKRSEARVRYFEDGVARVHGSAGKSGPDGLRFLDPAHPYALDLDLFGPSSLFTHLCMARTDAGQGRLASWLTQASAVDAIGMRQRAVAELSTKLPLRRDLWLAGGVLREEVRQAGLQEWLAAPTTPVATWQRVLTGVVGAFGVVVLYAFARPELIPLAVGVVLVQRLWAQRYRALTKSVEAQAFRRSYELRVLAEVARRLCQERFADPRLAALVASLQHGDLDGEQSAHRIIRRLERLANWLESRRNQLFAIPAVVLLLPEQLGFAIEAWRARHAGRALSWLSAIADVEALASLATFAFEHPAYAYPDVVEAAEPTFVAEGLGHPLLPAGARIANDLRLDAACRLLVVTGSNMSGKSTLLRSVGVNAVLALAGAPVCARSLRLSPLAVGASLRAQDSLEAGVSRFFAEIKRLHAILSLAAAPPPVLFLLDEILNGTNSQDRREGAEAVIRALLERGAIGLVTTHDLSLSALADRPGSTGRNVHFQDTLEGDRLVFDYRLRPGVVTRRNALDLMRLVGIDVAKAP